MGKLCYEEKGFRFCSTLVAYHALAPYHGDLRGSATEGSCCTLSAGDDINSHAKMKDK